MTLLEMLAKADQEQLTELFVTLTATFDYDITDRARERGFFHLENIWEDLKLDKKDLQSQANSLACDLMEP